MFDDIPPAHATLAILGVLAGFWLVGPNLYTDAPARVGLGLVVMVAVPLLALYPYFRKDSE